MQCRKILQMFFLLLTLMSAAGLLFAQEPEVIPQLGSQGPVRLLMSAAGGKYVLAVSSFTLQLLDAETCAEVRVLSRGIFPYPGEAACMAVSPNGRYALTGGTAEKTFQLWDLEMEAASHIFSGHTEQVTSLAFSPDGRYALSGSFDKTARLWDIATGRQMKNLKSSSGVNFPSMAFSADGRYALSGGNDNTTRLWDLASGKEVQTLTAKKGWSVTVAAISPDGKYAFSGQQNIVNLWDVGTGKLIREFSGFSAEVHSLAFTPDGGRALIGSSNGVMGLWNIETGKENVRFIHFDDGGWVCCTDRGYFNASPNRAEHLTVRDARGMSPMKGELLTRYFQPETIASILAGKE
jgi:hypothetical protein